MQLLVLFVSNALSVIIIYNSFIEKVLYIVNVSV